MERHILISESFESAAYALRNTMIEFQSRSGIDGFANSVDRFAHAVQLFNDAVDRLIEHKLLTEAANGKA